MLFGTGIAVSQALSLVLVLASVILQIFFLKKNSSAEQEDEKE